MTDKKSMDFQMVVAGRTADGPAGHEDAAQEGTAAAAFAQQHVLRLPFRLFRRQDAQFLQGFGHFRVGQDLDLVAVVLFQAPGARHDDFRAHLVVALQHLQDAPRQGRVLRREMDAHVHAAQDDGTAHAQHAEQLRLLAAGLEALQAGQFIFYIG